MAHKALEKLSYVCVIVTAFVVTGSTLFRLHEATITRQPDMVTASQLEGKQLPLEGMKWNSYKATVVLALSTGCHFCTSSAPFYRQLAALRDSRPKMNIIAVFPQSEQLAETYLKQKKIFGTTVVSTSLDNLMVQGTPTMFIVGPDGKVKQSWVGYLNEEQQQAVLKNIKGLTKG